MPVWASALITVIAALGAGTFGSWLTLHHNRRERFRDRMIEAADDYATAAAEALLKLRDAVGIVERSDNADAKIAAVETAWEHRDVAVKHSPRIALLFGPKSEASRSIDRFCFHLANGADLLTPKRTQGIQSDVKGAQRELQAAADEHASFYIVAYEEITRAAAPSEGVREVIRRRLTRSTKVRTLRQPPPTT